MYTIYQYKYIFFECVHEIFRFSTKNWSYTRRVCKNQNNCIVDEFIISLETKASKIFSSEKKKHLGSSSTHNIGNIITTILFTTSVNYK